MVASHDFTGRKSAAFLTLAGNRGDTGSLPNYRGTVAPRSNS